MAESGEVAESPLAARMLILLQRHNKQRERDQLAREVESAIVHKVVEVVFRQKQQASDSGPDYDTPDHDADDRREPPAKNRRRHMIAAIQRPPPPPGLEESDCCRSSGPGRRNGINLVPSQDWRIMDHAAREFIRRTGRGERQRRRRQRNTQRRLDSAAAAATTLREERWHEDAAAAAMSGSGAHLVLPWQPEHWQPYGAREQHWPQASQRTYVSPEGHMCIVFHAPYL